MTIFQKLIEYSSSHRYPFHMPGHKRAESFPSVLPLELDITEIPGFDNLHDAEGILIDAMEKAADFFGADRSFFLVNGSSGGILAAVRACTRRGDTLLMARGCHKSVYHAAELCGLRTEYLQAEEVPGWEMFGSISPLDVERALERHGKCTAVLITSPTYEGILSDISAIAEIVHRKGGILIVDEAHGAHLGLGNFPPSAIQCGADIAVQSLHKTLPTPTQTAILHLRRGRVNEKELQRQLAIFQTSSPSYLFLGAMDACVEYLDKNQDILFPAYEAMLRAFYQKTENLAHLRVYRSSGEVFAHDSGKIVISTKGTSITGPQLAERLRSTYFLETEMSARSIVLAMTSVCDRKEGLCRLADALAGIDATLSKREVPPETGWKLPDAVCTIAEAVQASKEEIPAEQAVGRISADYFWAYPPGIPLLVPGEKISREMLAYLERMRRDGVELHAAYSSEGKIFVLTLDTEFSAMV